MYCMKLKLLCICLYVCMYVVSTLLVLPGGLVQAFHYLNGVNNFTPIQGIPPIQWVQEVTSRTNRLHSIGSFHGKQKLTD